MCPIENAAAKAKSAIPSTGEVKDSIPSTGEVKGKASELSGEASGKAAELKGASPTPLYWNGFTVI